MQARSDKTDASDEARETRAEARNAEYSRRVSAPPAGSAQSGLSALANASPRAQALSALQLMADEYVANLAQRLPRPGHGVVQRYFTFGGKRLSAADMESIARWLQSKGHDTSAFETAAAAATDSGAISTYLRSNFRVFTPIQAIIDAGAALAPAAAASGKRALDPYESDNDSLSVSDGEPIDVFRPTTGRTVEGTLHSLRSARNQVALSIREMRRGEPLTEPTPTLARLGSSTFEMSPSPWRKDFGAAPMRPSEDGSALERDGNAEKYADIARRLDQQAGACHLSMVEMNQALKALFDNKDAQPADLNAKMSAECLRDLRELAVILLIDNSRSSRALAAITAQVFNNSSSFWDRFGKRHCEYVGAWAREKDGVGGVQKLREYGT